LRNDDSSAKGHNRVPGWIVQYVYVGASGNTRMSGKGVHASELLDDDA
jgi:hypothetical protein